MHRAAYYKLAERSSYPAEPPFDPHEIYPELRRMPALSTCAGASNPIYGTIRDLLVRLGLDRDHIGSDEWNPFGDFVSPGQNVVIKPNLVLHEHPQRRGAVVAIVTHPAVVRP